MTDRDIRQRLWTTRWYPKAMDMEDHLYILWYEGYDDSYTEYLQHLYRCYYEISVSKRKNVIVTLNHIEPGLRNAVAKQRFLRMLQERIDAYSA